MKWSCFGTGPARLVAAAAVVVAGIGLGVAALVGSFPAQASPDEVYVNDNLLPDVEGCNDAANKVDTITEGIGAADPGDTVIVCEGTYAGATISKQNVTVEGRAEANRAEVIVQGASDGLIIAAGDVTVRHLTLDGVDGSDNGIHVTEDGDRATIQDVEVFDWNNGIWLEGTDGSVVEDSFVYGNTNAGISAQGGEDNVIRRNNSGANNDIGLVVEEEDKALVEENELSGSTAGLRLNDGAALLHVHVVRNTIHAGSDGILINEIDSAESLIVIGGRAEDTNNFMGSPDGVNDFFVNMECGADTEITVNATHNYWSSFSVRSDIADRIWDDEDQDDCGTPHGAVVFHPWAAVAWTPTATVTPTPTATATATATPTPTATPTATPTPTGTPVPPTRDFDLPAGWNDFVWTGASDTPPSTVLSCIDGTYAIAYRFIETNGTFQRYAPARCGEPGFCNMGNLAKYEALLVLVTPVAAQCLGMPVEP